MSGPNTSWFRRHRHIVIGLGVPLAVVAGLLALLYPAVQAAREAAFRSQGI